MQVHGNIVLLMVELLVLVTQHMKMIILIVQSWIIGNALKVQIVIGKVMDGGQGPVKS